LLVIKDTAGNEVIRKMTTHLHNHIIMPDDSRGKQFVARASFMAHVDDEPHFGNQATFTIPLLIDDIRPDNKK
jgi:hypothetical protein